MNRHFKKQIDQLVNNAHRNLKCPNCDYEAGDRQSLLRHYTAKHGILEKLLSQALEERNIDDEMKVVENRGTKRKLVKVSEEEKNSTPKKLALSAVTLSNNNVIPKVVSTTNSTPQPTNILPKNTTMSLVPQIINADILPRKILPKVPTFTIKPLVPITTTEASTSAPKIKFQCQQCFKPFLNNRDLTRHSVVHTQEKNFRCSFCNAAFFGRKDHLVRHEQNCNKKMIVESKLSPGSAVQSFIRVRPLNQLMPSPITSVATEEEPIEEFNHPISDDPYIPTILDPTYYPVDYPVEDPVVQLVISEKTGENHIEENSIDQQEIIETELEHTATSEWSGITRVHSLIPTIIDDVVHDDDEAEKEMDVAIDENYDQEPSNLVIDENEVEDLELVIDEDFSSDVMVEDDQNDIINDDVNKRDICLHIPLKKRGKFSCINCSLQRVS